MKNNVLVLAGAVAGGVVGHLAFLWLRQQGLYSLILPGGLVGLGAGMFRCRSLAVCVACGVLALGLGLFSEWRTAPFLADDSLAYFATHLHQLRPVTLIMAGIGTFIGFWVPFRRRQDALGT